MLDERSIDIYSSRDKIREQIIELTKNYLKLENIDFNSTSYLSYLVNIISVLDSNLLYYVSSVYREQFLTKARQKSSILNLASMLGYIPDFAIPAVCSVLVEIPLQTKSVENEPDTVIELIGRNHIKEQYDDPDRDVFKVYTQDRIPFSLMNTTTIVINDNGVSVKQQVDSTIANGNVQIGLKTIEHRIVNGRIQFFLEFKQIEDNIETFTVPYLLPNEFHNIEYKFPKNGQLADINLFEIVSNIDNVLEEWYWKESLFNIAPNEKAFTHKETDTGIVILFGNGIIGKQPQQGTELIAKVGVTKGINGNVISGSIKISDPIRALVTVNNQTKVKHLTPIIINKEPSQFGSDAPTSDEIRVNAINRVSTNSRLVSQRDFQNASTFIEDLPINNIYQVLKRGDLKRNEITLFTELIYENVVVPTRNLTTYVDITGDTTAYQIKSDTTIVYDSENYITLFDMFINKYTTECKYVYYISQSDKPVTILETQKTYTPTKILPVFAHFETDRQGSGEDDLLTVELHCNNLDSTTAYTCYMKVNWPFTNGLNTYTLNDNTSLSIDSSSVKVFTTDFGDSSADYIITMDNVPDGKNIEFTFEIYDTCSNTMLNKSTASVILKRDLSDFMYSQVVEDTSTGYFHIYDVPCIKKDYYDNLNDKSKFTNQIMQKIISFDINDYKMLTDFVNLKFANTTGYSTNMQFNDVNKSLVNEINPLELPTSPLNGERYAFSDYHNPWRSALDNTGAKLFTDITSGGYIATYSTDTSTYTFDKLKVNDIFFVGDTSDAGTKYIYTGDEIIEPKISIPLSIRVVVFPSKGSTVPDQVLSKNIKDKLVDELASSFGYNKPLYISKLTEIVNRVRGVQHCKVLEPKHDIFFQDDLEKNMTEEQLLRFTPELIYFDTENILVEIKN